MRLRSLAISLLIGALALPGCGGDEAADKDSEKKSRGVTFQAAIRDAQAVSADDFPAPGGRTLQQIARTLPAVNVGLATSVFTPGRNRLAFGLIDENQTFVYGKTAVYLARGPKGKAQGPYLAPADPLVVEPPFQSQAAAKESDAIAAIYEARVELPAAGGWSVLTISKAQGKTYGAGATIQVKKTSSIPGVGAAAPEVETETRASVAGDVEILDTRVPPDDMHRESFKDVVGRKPVALLFATPALCESRVCGPVVDIAAQLKKKYGERVEFIHQEVFVDNDLKKGLRPPLRAFRLQTEPWLFTIDTDGRVAARLEGSFGNEAFERAIQAAL